MSSIIESKYLINPRIINLEEPYLQFSTSKRSINQSPLQGLSRYKPYDYNTNSRSFNHLRLIVICPSADSIIEKAELLLRYINEGMSYSKGMKEDFLLKSVEIPSKENFYIYNSNDLTSEKKKIQEIIRYEKKDLNFRNDLRLCIIHIGKDHSGFRDTESYYQSKRLLLSNGFPTQYVSIDSALAFISNDRNEFVLRNIQTNIYTKIGGIPWTLFKSGKETSSGICIGYAFGRYRKEGQDKYVPCTFSIFDKLGVWLGSFTRTLCNPIYSHTCDGMILSEEQSYGFLSEILNKYSSFKDLSQLKMVTIHKPGLFGRDEINGFQQLLHHDEKINESALVSINTRSNLRMIDETNSTGNVKRGTVFILSKNSGLLFSTGDTISVFNIKPKEHYLGTPAPLYVSIQQFRSGLSHELFFENCIQEVFGLTSLHWENIWGLEYRLPVTLRYAQKAAKLVANGISVHNDLEDTPWFL